MTAADNPYAALEALEVKARTSRNHRTTHRLGVGRRLCVEQDAAVRDPHYHGGAVFEFWYRYHQDDRERLLTRVEAQDLLDGYEPEPQAPFDEAEFVKRAAAVPTSMAHAETAYPMKYTTPMPVFVYGERTIEAQKAAKATALATLPDPEWWDAKARPNGAGWDVSFERRIRRRE